MDAHRFDAFARALGTDSSRRALGRFLGGLALGGGIVASAAERAAARKKKNKKKKKKNRKKKDCSGGCRIGTCCDGKCANTPTDGSNCGACGNICTNREECRNGQCVCSGVNCSDGTCCPAGFEVCIGNGIGCCPNNSHYCGNGRCCPDGFTCGGSCGGECCA